MNFDLEEILLKFYDRKTNANQYTEVNSPVGGCWVHIENASTTDLQELSELTGLEYVNLIDCLDRYEVPRIETTDDVIIFFARFPSDIEVGLYTSTISIILTEKYFITITPHKDTLINTFLNGDFGVIPPVGNKLMLLILMRIAQEFASNIRRIRYSVLGAEKEMINVESEDIAVLTKNEEILNQYISCLLPLRSMWEHGPSRLPSLYEKDSDLVEDLLNAFRQAEDSCAVLLKSIRSLRDAYQIIFTNNMHKTIKALTSLTIILSIPTMVASLYGMNVALPLEKSPHAFFLIVLLIAAFSLGGSWIFKRKNWL